MTIEELKNKHYRIDVESAVEDKINPKAHTKLSIEFAISVLQEFENDNFSIEYHTIDSIIKDKIQELKQYIIEKIKL